ncbi:MAG: transposase [Gammaproteobacteria bacterium]|nr:transposase [Gammaproteobacteria bacterium]
MRQKKKWSATAKFEIALLAVKGETTLNEICQRFEVAPGQVHVWKKQLFEQGAQVFSKADKSATTAAQQERTRNSLYEKIGQLTMERDFLKKAFGKFQLSKGEDLLI